MSNDDLAAFREEMKRRGVYERPAPRLMTREERTRRNKKPTDLSDFRAEMIARGVYRNGNPVLTAAEQKKPRGRQGGRRETPSTFYGEIVQAAKDKLSTLDARSGFESLPCPWRYFNRDACPTSCRCRGTGNILIATLRGHYAWMAAEYARFA